MAREEKGVRGAADEPTRVAARSSSSSDRVCGSGAGVAQSRCDAVAVDLPPRSLGMWRVVMEGTDGYKEAQTDPRRAARACGGLEGGGLVDGTADGGSARLAARREKVMVVLSGARRGMEIVEFVECRS